MKPYIRKAEIILALLLLLGVVVTGPSAGAQGENPPPLTQESDATAATEADPLGAVPGAFWTSTGSTGTVDEADQGLILHEGAYVRTRPNITGDAIIRYNVVGVDGLLPGGAARRIFLLSHFYDNGASARVITRLYRVPHFGAPAPGLLLTIDSGLPGGAGWTTLTTSNCFQVDFNFGRYAYYVEVLLINTTPNAITALSTLRIYATTPC